MQHEEKVMLTEEENTLALSKDEVQKGYVTVASAQKPSTLSNKLNRPSFVFCSQFLWSGLRQERLYGMKRDTDDFHLSETVKTITYMNTTETKWRLQKYSENYNINIRKNWEFEHILQGSVCRPPEMYTNIWSFFKSKMWTEITFMSPCDVNNDALELNLQSSPIQIDSCMIWHCLTSAKPNLMYLWIRQMSSILLCCQQSCLSDV